MPAETSYDHRQLLLPAPIRRPAIVWAVACALAFLTLAVTYHGTEAPGGFDSWVNGYLPGGHVPRDFLRPMTNVIPLLLAGGAAIAWLAEPTWRYAALAVAGPGLTLLVAEVGKVIIGRRDDGILCLPSGHTAVVTSLALVGALMVVDRVRDRAVLAAVAGIVAVTVLAGVMAYMLVTLRYHYATDTIAGYGAATATTLGVAFAVDALARRLGTPSWQDAPP